MSTGRITFRKGGHPSSRSQLVSGPGSVPLSRFDNVFTEIEAARKRNKRNLPEGEEVRLSGEQGQRILLALIGVAQVHRGLHGTFGADPKARDVRRTLLALAKLPDEAAFRTALRDADAVTQDKIALAAWKSEYKREGDRTSSPIIARLGIAELQQLARSAAATWSSGKGRRPPDEHHDMAIRSLAHIWRRYTRTDPSPGAKESDGPFIRFVKAARAATQASWPTNRDAVERALRARKKSG